MKIVIFDMDNLKNPHWAGGQALVTSEIGKRLSKKHNITVYCSKYPGWKNYTENGIEYRHIGLGSNNPKLNNIMYIFAIPFTALFLKADLIIEDFVAPISICLSPLYTNIPVIGRGSFFAPGEMTKKYHLPFDVILNQGIKLYKHFIALNPNQVKLMSEINPKICTHLIYNGVDSKNFNHPISDGQYILYMGRIDIFHKGIDMLINAYSKISSEINDKIYIMGSGSEEEISKLNKLIGDLNLKDRIKLLGRKTDEEKNSIIANSKYMVIPSRYEGHSLASLEAISFGKPFIFFSVSGFEWVKEGTSLRTSPFDLTQYSNHMLRLSQDESFRLEMSKNAREFAKEFDWDLVTEKYNKIFHEVSQIKNE